MIDRVAKESMMSGGLDTISLTTPINAQQNAKKILFNMRIDERLRNDFKMHCRKKYGTDMTEELIKFIKKELEEGEK